MHDQNIPTGFAMALAENPDAANTYSMLTQAQKATVLDKAQKAKSQRQMQKIVNTLAKEQMM